MREEIYEDVDIFVNTLNNKNMYDAYDIISDLIYKRNINPNFVCDIFTYIITTYDRFIMLGDEDLNMRASIRENLNRSEYSDEDEDDSVAMHFYSLLESAMIVNNIKLIDIIMNYYEKKNMKYNGCIIKDALDTPAFKYMVEKYDILNKYNIYTNEELNMEYIPEYTLQLIHLTLCTNNIYKLHTIFNYIYLNYHDSDNIVIVDEEIDAYGLILKIIKDIFKTSEYNIMIQFIEQNISIINEILERNYIYIYLLLFSIYSYSINDEDKQKFYYLIDKFIIEPNKEKYGDKDEIIKKILYDIHNNNNYQLIDGIPYFENGEFHEEVIIGRNMLEFDAYDVFIPYISKYVIENIIYFKLYLCNHILLNKENKLMQYIDSIYYLKEDMNNDDEFFEFLQKLLPLVIQEGTYEDIIRTIEIIYSLQPNLNIISEKIICNYCKHYTVKCKTNKNMINRLIGSPNNMCEKITQLCSNMECIHNYINEVKTDITLKNIEKTLKEKNGFPIEVRHYISNFTKQITPEEYKKINT